MLWRTETVHLLALCALPKEVELLAPPPHTRGAPRRRTSLRFAPYPRRWSFQLRRTHSWRTETVHLLGFATYFRLADFST